MIKGIGSLAALAIAVTIGLGSPAEAKWKPQNPSSINGTQKRLETRINQASRKGYLTQAEAIPLRARLSQIAILEAQYRASGGRLSDRERLKLRQQLNNLAQSIDRELNDCEVRWSAKHRNQWKNNWKGKYDDDDWKEDKKEWHEKRKEQNKEWKEKKKEWKRDKHDDDD